MKRQDDEPILDPELPIVDAHHHLWFFNEQTLSLIESLDHIEAKALAPLLRERPRYLFDEFLADVSSGHNVRATVYVQAHSMYRADGPEELRSVGEIEFANGVAAMSASGAFGDAGICSAIVGGVDLRTGSAVGEVLEAHLVAGGGRYRGVRSPVIHDEDETILGPGYEPDVLMSASFRQGFDELGKRGLSCDVLALEPQLPQVVDLAHVFPETSIIVNHGGLPVHVGRYAGQRDASFARWRENIYLLAKCPNVFMKLGGFGVPFGAFESFMKSPRSSSMILAEEWKPYIETCIESFGADRCMFASNFPIDSSTGTYSSLWNAFKLLAAGATPAEKTALFSGTAARVYRIPVTNGETQNNAGEAK
jgi:predicted TIM-barrel fold metal-dependent hydrolase